MAEPRYIVDSGPIVAALNRRDAHHAWAKAVFASLGEPPVTCEAVLTEVCWHLRESPQAVARVLEMPSRGDLRLFSVVETEGVALAGLVRKYGKRMDLADAGIVRLAEIFPRAKVITTDVEDFRVYRRNRNEPLLLIHP
ncbi:MAG: PIN domain-containing protein [Opitutaceae bacterium]|nr:PIN domain-containing protein [Opitutaceae bacterium]